MHAKDKDKKGAINAHGLPLISKHHLKDKLLKLNLSMRARRILFVGGLIAVTVLLFLLLSPQMKHNNQLVCTQKDDGILLKQAATKLDPADSAKMEELSKVVEKIKESKQYEKDFNCVYAVISYYIYQGEKDAAKAEYEKLKKLVDQGQSLSSQYDYQRSLNELKMLVDYLETREKETQSNTILF